MVSSGMLHRVALVRTDVSEELSASFIRVTKIGELGTTVTSQNTPFFIIQVFPLHGCYLALLSHAARHDRANFFGLIAPASADRLGPHVI
jgi:hypothetical protein